MAQATDVELAGAGYMLVPGSYKRAPLGGSLDRPGGRLSIDRFGGGQRQPAYDAASADRSWDGLGVVAIGGGAGVEPWPNTAAFGDLMADLPSAARPTRGLVLASAVAGGGSHLFVGLGRRLYRSVATSAPGWGTFAVAADLGPGIQITDLARYKDDLLILCGAAPIRRYNTATGALANPWIAGEVGTVGVGYKGQIVRATGSANDNFALRLSLDKFDGTVQFRSRFVDAPIVALGTFRGAVVIATAQSLYTFDGNWDPGSSTVLADWSGEPAPFFSHGATDPGDLSWLLELRGRLYTWLGGGVVEFDPGLGGGWRQTGPRGAATYGATVAAGSLVVATDGSDGPELWAFDGRGWWRIGNDPAGAPRRLWPQALAGAGNRDLLVFRDGTPTYDLHRLAPRSATLNAYPAAAEWVSPLLDAGDGSRAKAWSQVGAAFGWPEIRGNPASADPVTVALDYSVDGGAVWVEAATATLGGAAAGRFAGLRAAIVPAAGSRTLQLRARWASVLDWAPVLTGVWADYGLIDNAPRRRRWTLKVHARDGQVRRDGGAQAPNGRQLAAALWQAWQAGDAVAYRDVDYDADPSERTVRIAEIAEEVPKPADAGRWGESVLTLALVESGGTAAASGEGGGVATPAPHTHDERYHTEAEIAALLAAGGDLVIVPADRQLATAASNPSAVTYLEWLSATRILPAGTWEISAQFTGSYVPSAAAGGPEVRIAAPILGDPKTAAALLNDRGAVVCVAQGSVGSDGATPTVFRVEYRRNAALSGTPNAEVGSLFAVCRRTA